MTVVDGGARMYRAVTFLLQPTAGQQGSLGRLVEAQRELYNAALEERRGAWAWERRRVSRFEQFGQLAALRGLRPEVMEFGVCPARGSLTRLDRAFAGFFRRVKAGQAPGFPRFRAAGRFDSVEYPDSSCWAVDERAGRLYLQGVGHVRFRRHRPLPGAAKTLTVRREGRRFRVTVFCEVDRPEPKPKTGRQVGLDLGVAALYATSEGALVDNPRWLARSAERLAAAQAVLARKQKGSARRRKAVERVGGIHRTVGHQRRDLHHQLSRQLVDGFDVICHEDLPVAAMTRSARGSLDAPGVNVAAKRGLNRSILDAGWAQLLRFVTYKAEEAGRETIAVDARHTSQTCAQCGHRHRDNRVSQAVFRCRRCGHQAHADINAARNILRAGLAHRSPREARERAS
ncbi:MAG: RNA-guided endonuclease InsQ/TnpB family protein [Acidimicrobiia bacterium]